MAFPYPSLLSSIEDLLKEVKWLEGLILISESRRPTFVSFAQLGPLLRKLRCYPRGEEVSELLKNFLFDGSCGYSEKPVLVLQPEGRFWLGLMGLGDLNLQKDKEIEYLNRCFKLNILE